MGYEVFITRTPFGLEEKQPAITLEEWLDYVEQDAELRHDEAAEIVTPDGTKMRMQGEGICVWTGWSMHDDSAGRRVYLDFRRGRIFFNGVNEIVFKKMFSIAEALCAVVQGDAGELYGPDGKALRT